MEIYQNAKKFTPDPMLTLDLIQPHKIVFFRVELCQYGRWSWMGTVSG